MIPRIDAYGWTHPGVVLTTLFKELGPNYQASSGGSLTGRSAVDDRLAGIPALRTVRSHGPATACRCRLPPARRTSRASLGGEAPCKEGAESHASRVELLRANPLGAEQSDAAEARALELTL